MFVNRWIETHAHIRPNKVALIDRVSGISYTYLDLYRTSRLQAQRLAALGVRPGDRVAVYSQNRPEVLELLLACGWLGACLVPLNWRLAPQELEKIVEDCGPSITFLDPNLPCDLPGQSLFSLQSLDAPSVSFPEVGPEAPLAIFYTGGTTGVPKGAVLTHASMQWNAWNTICGWGLSPDDVAPIFTPMFHTGGLNVMATPLLCLGGTLVLPGNFEAHKALEVIEAHWLFGLPPERIEVVVHPQSVIHSLVEYVDGSVLAQLGHPDMRTPIGHALGWPERLAVDVPPHDLVQIGKLGFEAPDHARFPSLGLAYEALRAGGGASVVLNAANEMAVAAFLDRRLPFVRLPEVIARALAELGGEPAGCWEAVIELDRRTRASCAAWMEGGA